MTAQIVTQDGRTPIRAHYAMPWAGDSLARNSRPGQLWERIAELGQAGVVNLPQYTPRIADAARRAFERAANPADTLAFTPPDPQLALTPENMRSGIIRAGVRTR